MTREFIGWGVVGSRNMLTLLVPTPAGLGIDVTGYHEADYWQNGKFLGPDMYGITPVYTIRGKQFPKAAQIYPHLA